MPTGLRISLAAALASMAVGAALAQGADVSAKLEHLVAAYPDQLERIEANTLVWRDGTRMALDDGKGTKDFEAWLDHPDIEDMLAIPYPAGSAAQPRRIRTSTQAAPATRPSSTRCTATAARARSRRT